MLGRCITTAPQMRRVGMPWKECPDALSSGNIRSGANRMPTRVEAAKARVEQIKPFADFSLTCLSVGAIIVGGSSSVQQLYRRSELAPEKRIPC